MNSTLHLHHCGLPSPSQLDIVKTLIRGRESLKSPRKYLLATGSAAYFPSTRPRQLTDGA